MCTVLIRQSQHTIRYAGMMNHNPEDATKISALAILEEVAVFMEKVPLNSNHRSHRSDFKSFSHFWNLPYSPLDCTN